MSAITIGVEMDVTVCGCCGGTYALAEDYVKRAREHGTSWTCPYCKVGWGYSGRGELAKLRKQLETEQAARERAQQRARELEASRDHERKRVQGYQGALTKVKKRVGNGVCPCCQWTFKDLARHMGTQHPTYSGETA